MTKPMSPDALATYIDKIKTDSEKPDDNLSDDQKEIADLTSVLGGKRRRRRKSRKSRKSRRKSRKTKRKRRKSRKTKRKRRKSRK